MRHTITNSVAILALSFLPALAGAQKMTGTGTLTSLPAPVALEQDGLFNKSISRIGDDMFVGGQPTEAGLRAMRALGVTTVVNLRPQAELDRDVKFDEPALVKSLGMTYVHIPVRGTEELPYSPAAVKTFAVVMRSAPGKVLLHCTVGWRASHMWAAYLISERGVPDDSAVVNARAIYLMDSHRGEQPIEQFLGRKVQGLKR